MLSIFTLHSTAKEEKRTKLFSVYLPANVFFCLYVMVVYFYSIHVTKKMEIEAKKDTKAGKEWEKSLVRYFIHLCPFAVYYVCSHVVFYNLPHFSRIFDPLKMSLEMAHKVIVPQKKNYVPQFLKQRDINS